MEKHIRSIIIFLIVFVLIVCIILGILLINKEKHSSTEIKNEIDLEEKTKYDGEEFKPIVVDSATLASMYLNDFKTDMIYNLEDAYDKLDAEYKEKKFPKIDDFKEYIDKQKERIMGISIDKYQIINEEGENNKYEYVITDKDGRYYIFNISAVMQYTVILDTYTLDLPQFIEKYNSSSDEEKVLLNIQKVFEAINDGDYRYVYNKLDPTFRQTNFPTEDSFATYVKQNFYENNSLSYSNYKTSGDLHIYEMKIKDKENEANPEKTKTFIMQLKEGTDFVMSFNVK